MGEAETIDAGVGLDFPREPADAVRVATSLLAGGVQHRCRGLRDTSGTKPLHAPIKPGKESGLLTEQQTDFLRGAQAPQPHRPRPEGSFRRAPTLEAGMLTTSFTLISEVWAAQPTPPATTDTDEGTGI